MSLTHDEDPGHIYQIEGELGQIELIFRAYYEHLFIKPPSGDDDVFDYWPSAVDLAKQIAADLDEATNTKLYSTELRRAYDDFVKEFGEVMEFEF